TGCAGRHDQHRLGRRSRDPDSSAQECLPHADRHVAMHSVALPLKSRMLADPRADNEIAARSPERAGIALADDADLGPGVDARGNGHADRLDSTENAALETR